MKKLRGLSAVFALCLATSGCYHIQFVRRLPAEETPTERLWHHTFVFGLVEGSSTIDVSHACPGGIAVIDARETLGNSVVSTTPLVVALSLTMWTTGFAVPFDAWSPIAVDITCAAHWLAPAPLAQK